MSTKIFALVRKARPYILSDYVYFLDEEEAYKAARDHNSALDEESLFSVMVVTLRLNDIVRP
jgi:hypothetical protein